MSETQTTHKDFFISYTSIDKKWAEWIAWHLEKEGYTTILQTWDFHPGGNFVLDMDTATRTAKRTLAVLSPDYFSSIFTPSEWTAAFRRDPKGEQDLLVPVRVRPCDIEGLLGQIVYIDLVGMDEHAAQTALLAGVLSGRRKPTNAPIFPSVSLTLPVRPTFPGALPAIWNVPYPRNPYFTGREELLARLVSALRGRQMGALSQPQAISGLGGIGKTQIVVEYTYRYHQDYEAVLWAQAESHDILISSFMALAHLLGLPEQEEQNQMLVVRAVLRWLRIHEKWLLIFDNADELALIKDFLPSAAPGGHVLLTTRAQAMGRLAQPHEVYGLSPELGALFLLCRAGFITPHIPLEKASPVDVIAAQELSVEMGGLPLALDQAGAYIEETQCTLLDYQQLYRTCRADLLKERGGVILDHPKPVATTWSLSFQKIEQESPAAADLLRACAFLSPDAIPEGLITEGAAYLGPVLKQEASDSLVFNKAARALLTYSLIRRDATAKLFSVHRLVQAVLKESMDETTVRQWIERVVRAVNAVFPYVEFATWQHCEQYLPHAFACVELINRYGLAFLEAAELLTKLGWYLQDHARYAEVEPLFQQALFITEQALGTMHADTATALNNLAQFYRIQGRGTEAEPLFQQVLTIREQILGPEHSGTAATINNLAQLYQAQGRNAEAEPLFQRALAIDEQALGSDHPYIAAVLEHYANLLHEMKRSSEAATLEDRAKAIRAKSRS